MKILLVEDDKNLGESLTKYLSSQGFSVDWVNKLADAYQFELKDNYLVVLDWMLPDGQGIDFLRKVRNEQKLNPIIMLTAKNDLIDKVLGLESGANDYITKPFEPRELVARIRSQERFLKNISQNLEQQNEQVIEVAQIRIDKNTRIVTFKGEEVPLTKMEFDLLVLLAEKPGRAYSRDEILNKVWGFENFPTTRTVDTHVLQLRNKFSDELIETVRGVGYRFQKRSAVHVVFR
jgi:DNA-binding response OmpR family regulator